MSPIGTRSTRPDRNVPGDHAGPGRDGPGRGVVVGILVVVQTLVLALAPLIEPTPTPDHRVHLAGETDGGCAPVHDDFHCVVCRAASADRLAGDDIGLLPPHADGVRSGPPPRDLSAATRPETAPPSTRAPPRA